MSDGLREVSDLAFKARRVLDHDYCWVCTDEQAVSELGLCSDCLVELRSS